MKTGELIELPDLLDLTLPYCVEGSVSRGVLRNICNIQPKNLLPILFETEQRPTRTQGLIIGVGGNDHNFHTHSFHR